MKRVYFNPDRCECWDCGKTFPYIGTESPMLKDEMKHKENSLNIMEKEKQTLIISIAHGIKTPLSNIKLYAEAIERGIYHEDKKPNEKDAETAAKISRNVEKVEALVKDIMDKSAEYNVDYTPKINSFYLEELMKMVKKEYSGRAELLHNQVRIGPGYKRYNGSSGRRCIYYG